MKRPTDKMEVVDGWQGKFLLGPKHTYWWRDKGKDRPLSGITSVLNVIDKSNLIQWAANLAAAQAYGYAPPPDFKQDLEAVIQKYGKLTSDAVKELCQKYPELHTARVAHRNTATKAANLGTDAHGAIESYIKLCLAANGGVPLPSNSIESRVLEFANWAQNRHKSHQFKFVASETPLADPKLAIAGTPDFIAEETVDGLWVPIIGDLKTGSGIYDRVYFFQMAAYAYMWMKWVGRNAEPRLVIIHAPAQNQQPLTEYWSDDWKGDWLSFQAALRLHRTKDNFVKQP